jgi:CheY-like chemotaxis protein
MNYTLDQNKRVLFIDDDHEDQEIFGEVLGLVNSSICCSFADTAEDALQALGKTNEKPDYIFLDLNLPYMSGFECLNSIKKEHYLKHIPVIIYSTSSRDTDKQKAKELGAVKFISKPDNFVQLQAVLRDIFCAS